MVTGRQILWLPFFFLSSTQDEIGIAARVTFEVLAGEKAESCLTVSNDGTAAIWYDWRRQAQSVTFEETKEKGIPYFYFNTRPGEMWIS